MARLPVTEILSLLLALGIPACSSSTSDTAASAGSTSTGGYCAPGPATGDLPCDVAAVLKASCQPCHQTPLQHGAHFPLLTYEDTQKPFGLAPADGGPPKLRYQRMAEVIVPGAQPHMPSQVAPARGGQACTLSDADRAVLEAWFAACAPPAAEKKGCDLGE